MAAKIGVACFFAWVLVVLVFGVIYLFGGIGL
jgi:hypothetical protein